MKKIKIFIVLLSAFSIFIGCTGHSSDLDWFGTPKKLVIGIYKGDDPAQTEAIVAPLTAYLQKKLDMDVSFYFAPDYTSLIEALQSKKIQMAYLTPFPYILATKKPGLYPIATLAMDGNPITYHSIIITNSKTGLKTMDDVKARSKSLSLSFADPASTSGHLIPRVYLISIGLNPDSAFKTTMFAGSHVAVVMSVDSGKSDLGCTAGGLGYDALFKQSRVKKENITILWTSPPIPNDALTVRSDLNKDFVKKLQDAYLDVAKDDFPAFSKFVKRYWSHPETMSYIKATDSLYSQLRKIADHTKYIK